MRYYKFPNYRIPDPNLHTGPLRATPSDGTYGVALVMSDRRSDEAIYLRKITSGSDAVRTPRLRSIDGPTTSTTALNTDSYIRLVNPDSTVNSNVEVPSMYPGTLYDAGDDVYVWDERSCKILSYDADNKISSFVVAQFNADRDYIGFYRCSSLDPSTGEGYIEKVGEYSEIDSDGNTIPTINMFVDDNSKLLFASLRNTIVAIDYTDMAAPSSVGRFEFTDTNRDNIIRDMTMDVQKNILICTTSNSDAMYDTLFFVYFDPSSKTFTLRSQYTGGDRCDYYSIELYNGYIYTADINSIDNNAQDTLRDKPGIKILSSSDNYQSITAAGSLSFGKYWNNTDMPLNNADPGHLPNDKTRHVKITLIKNGIMYAVAATPTKIADGKHDYANSSNLKPLYIVMYDIGSNPINPDIIGTTVMRNNRFNDDFFYSTYHLRVIDDNQETGVKKIIELTKDRWISSIIQQMDTSAIELLQEVTTDSVTGDFFDVDYVYDNTPNNPKSAPFMAIAEGVAGIAIYYFNENSNKYEFFNRLQPLNPEDNTPENIKTIEITGSAANVFYIFAAGQKYIYNYTYASTSFALTQTYKIADYINLVHDIGTDPDLDVRFSSFDFGNLSRHSFLTVYVEHHLPRTP